MTKPTFDIEAAMQALRDGKYRQAKTAFADRMDYQSSIHPDESERRGGEKASLFVFVRP